MPHSLVEISPPPLPRHAVALENGAPEARSNTLPPFSVASARKRRLHQRPETPPLAIPRMAPHRGSQKQGPRPLRLSCGTHPIAKKSLPVRIQILRERNRPRHRNPRATLGTQRQHTQTTAVIIEPLPETSRTLPAHSPAYDGQTPPARRRATTANAQATNPGLRQEFDKNIPFRRHHHNRAHTSRRMPRSRKPTFRLVALSPTFAGDTYQPNTPAAQARDGVAKLFQDATHEPSESRRGHPAITPTNARPPPDAKITSNTRPPHL